MIGSLNQTLKNNPDAALTSLEADAAFARAGFACLFSTSDEYERALIKARRAQGRYRQRFAHWPVMLFVACTFMVAATAVLAR